MKAKHQVTEHIAYSATLCKLVYEYSTDEAATKEKIKTLFIDSEVELKWFNIEATDTQALIVKQQNNLFIVFQGSQSDHDWANNAIFELVPYTSGSGHYHRGFMNICNISYTDVGTYIQNEVTKNANLKITVTGHSLGGAMAMLYALLLQKAKINVTQLITFGQPRCGNLEFVNFYSTLKIPYYRFVNDGDYISDVPPPYRKSNWSHTGDGFLLQTNSVLRYNDDYEKLLLVRYILTAIIAVKMLIAKNFNAHELAKNHDMELYEKNVLSNLVQISKMVDTAATEEESQILTTTDENLS